MRRRLTFANVTALLALFFALTTGSYAALKLPANSVTTAQVKNHSLLGADFKKGQLPRGPQGEPGLDGQTGPAGPQGPPGPVVLGKLTRIEQTASIGAGVITHVIATCPSGMNVVSGGFQAGGSQVFYSDSFGQTGSWSVGYDNYNNPSSDPVATVAYCAPAGQAVAAGVRSQDRHLSFKALRQIRTLDMRQRNSHHAIASKTCGSGYKHAVINGAQKCLRRGQYCSHSADRQYHRYGFHCHKRGAHGLYHLT